MVDKLSDGVVLEILDETQSRYRWLSKARLVEISKEPDLKKRNAAVWAEGEPFQIGSTNQVDYTLVLDGLEDQTSWEELWEDE